MLPGSVTIKEVDVKELIENGLVGKGLIPVDSSEMVRRYNACLIDMGLKPTELQKFQIDAMGWSPEIAIEQGNDYYLSHGEANQLAIVLYPEQRHAQIYFPFHSFDWDILKQWFNNHMPQIREVTMRSGIWLDIDQEIEIYRSPSDLLLVGGVMVKSLTPERIMIEGRRQKDMVRKFMGEENAFMDRELLEEMCVSQRKIGDVRTKSVVISDMQFSDVRSFYTRAFGGVFVFRNDMLREEVVAMKSLDLNEGASKKVTHVDSKDFLGMLKKSKLVTFSEDWWREDDHLLRMASLQESFLMEVLDTEFPDLDFISLTSAQQKGFIVRVRDKLPSEYFEFERLCHILKKGSSKVGKLCDCVATLVLHPNPDLPRSLREVIWHALTVIPGGRRRVFRTYRHEKELFFAMYKDEWKKPTRTWSVKQVEAFHSNQMK